MSLSLSFSVSLCVFGAYTKIAPFNLLPPSLWGVSLSLFSPYLLYTELDAQIIQEEDLRCLSYQGGTSWKQ